MVLDRAEPLRVAAGEAAEVGGLIDLTSNFPAPIPAQASLGDLLPTEESAVELLADLLRYPNAAGALRHRVAACDWLRHLGLAVDPECTLLTNGAEGALAAAMLALARPGDAILAEQLCYSGLRSLAARLGQHLEPVQMDEHGIVPDALAAAVRQRGSRLLVLCPTLHNPTAILTPLARREAIVAVARELDILMVEDDVYGPLVPDRPPAFATLAPERTLYITSLSKFLAPGLRLGFACGPVELVRSMTAAQRDLSLGHAPLAGELFARALKAGAVAEALRQQRLEMIERQQLAASLLPGLDLRCPAHRPACLAASAAALEQRRGLAGARPHRRPGGSGRSVLHRPRGRTTGHPPLAVGARDPDPSAQRSGTGGLGPGARGNRPGDRQPGLAADGLGQAAEQAQRHAMPLRRGPAPARVRRHGSAPTPARPESPARPDTAR